MTLEATVDRLANEVMRLQEQVANLGFNVDYQTLAHQVVAHSGVLGQKDAARFLGHKGVNRITEFRRNGSLPFIQYDGSDQFFYRIEDLRALLDSLVQTEPQTLREVA